MKLKSGDIVIYVSPGNFANVWIGDPPRSCTRLGNPFDRCNSRHEPFDFRNSRYKIKCLRMCVLGYKENACSIIGNKYESPELFLAIRLVLGQSMWFTASKVEELLRVYEDWKAAQPRMI